ncbi:hypothetical protein EJ110_NYTH14987 [Nymphaea thermarum]|nr:hypothetical protein EJ110_NYTH14987 [Nymphaea thermarum]
MWMSKAYPLYSNTYPLSDQDDHNMCIEVFHVLLDLDLFLYHGKSIVHFVLLQMRQEQMVSHRSWRIAFSWIVRRRSCRRPTPLKFWRPFPLPPLGFPSPSLLLGAAVTVAAAGCRRRHCRLGRRRRQSFFYRRCRSSFPAAGASCLCLFVMAELMGSPKDVGLDAGSASKAENVPIQVTSIRLTKDNYLSYSVSSDMQPLILRKPTSFDMWTVLAKMYGRKKRHLRTYQIKRSIYSLTQGDLSVAAFYAALKTKWEELDYHVTDEWKCGSDHSLYWEKEWMDRTFLFLGGLRDEFEVIRSQILNGDEIPGIEDVYVRVESEEQRRQVMHLTPGSVHSAFVSRASGTGQHPARRCTHCNKLGHSVEFCWDLHPEKRLVRGRPPFGRRSPSLSDSSQGTSSSGVKTKLSPDQLKELQAYIGRLSTTPEEGGLYILQQPTVSLQMKVVNLFFPLNVG